MFNTTSQLHWNWGCTWESILQPFAYSSSLLITLHCYPRDQTWVKYVIVLDSSTCITDLVWCIVAYDIVSNSANPDFWSSLLAQLHQARSTEHRKVIESKTMTYLLLNHSHWRFHSYYNEAVFYMMDLQEELHNRAEKRVRHFEQQSPVSHQPHLWPRSQSHYALYTWISLKPGAFSNQKIRHIYSRTLSPNGTSGG